MIWSVLKNLSHTWLHSIECNIKDTVAYIKQKDCLRASQVEAIEIYFFLKIKAENKPLWKLISEGFFAKNENLDTLQISHELRVKLRADTVLQGLFDLTRQKLPDGKTLFPELEQHIKDKHGDIDALQIIKKLFYDISYTDYLFSLPMGAGKTYLMASLIYLDLYFALNEPDNKVFAHNFLVMIPSGLKSSIGPSLKSILNFDPTWILPENAALNIKKMISFEILDEAKSAKKSNRTQNPNAQKVASYQPFDSLMGLVLIVNAEKVILDRLEIDNLLNVIEKTEDEKDRLANELRNIIGKIPNLQIYIDEVHHAATDDIKLRQVVNKWSANGTINSVLGFSGTPYLSSAESISISDSLKLKSTQISNTVYYYPLTTAIQKFLKKPRVEQVRGLEPIEIVSKGVKHFLDTYGDKVYSNGTCAKTVIYCGSIERLEEEIYPHLLKTGIDALKILKYHKGNTKYKLPKQNETEFLSLDTPLSKKQIILLVQIGKEGWDCKSLTGVILSQKGDCPPNMILQTSCRCLRQMDGEDDETALIYLNDDNAKILDKQLREEQHTSINEINNLTKTGEKQVERFSRIEHLKLPKIDFYKMQIESSTVVVENTKPEKKINEIQKQDFEKTVQITTKTLDANDIGTTHFEKTVLGEVASFEKWLFDISKESFGDVTRQMLKKHSEILEKLFNAITVEHDDILHFNAVFDIEAIKSKVRLAFHSDRTLKMIEEIIPQSVELLKIDKLQPILEHDKIYPTKDECEKILELDSSGLSTDVNQDEMLKAYELLKQTLSSQGMANFVMPFSDFAKQHGHTDAIKNRDKAFHYLPYDFTQSGFEQHFLTQVMSLEIFKNEALEIYYNGDKALTEFKINCYEKTSKGWKRVGKYTPDFLVIKRDSEKIAKILIVETKGEGYASQEVFIKKMKFTKDHFIPLNNDKFGYKRFDYLYIQDDDKEFLAKAEQKIIDFFKGAKS